MRRFLILAAAYMAAAQTDSSSTSSISASSTGPSSTPILSSSSTLPCGCTDHASSEVTPSATSSVSASSSSPLSSTASSSLSSIASSLSSIASSPLSSIAPSTASAAGSVITVATDGSGQFTAISPALSYAQNSGIPTVSIKAGTYTDSIVVQATAAVTVIGEASSPADYSQNKVVVSNSGLPLSWNTAASLGTTWKNINFVNPGTAGPAVSLSGPKNAFYNCQFVSAGALGISASTGTTFIYNSYIEAQGKLIYNTPNMYIYGSTITPTASNALLVFNKGVSSNNVVSSNSTVVFDSCTVAPKSGSTVSRIYLAAGNGDGSVVVWRNSALSSFIASTGVYVNANTQRSTNFYGEFGNTGAGAYSANSAARASYVTSLSVDQLSQFTADQVFAKAPASVATSNTNWIDSSAISVIQDSDASQVAKASTVAVVSSTSSSSSSQASSSIPASSISSSSVSSASTVSSSSVTTTGTSSISSSGTSALVSSSSSLSSVASTSESASTSTIASTSSAVSSVSSSSQTSDGGASSTTTSSATVASSSTSACSLPSSVPTTARVVGPAGSCANYTSIAAAINDMSSDTSKTEYVYILAGTYTEQIVFTRVGATVFRGESSAELDQSSNKVIIKSSSGVLSSNGGSSATAPFQATQYYSKSIAFYNINFENDYPATTGYNAVALSTKAKNIYYYNCGITSSQGALLLNLGSHYFSGCKITGTTDIVWGQGGAYFYNSKIVSTGTASGQSISAQSYQSQYAPSQFVFDTCTFVPKDTNVPKASTYLGRDYTTSARVAVINSYLDAHIAPIGWLIASKTTNVTFVEASNSGPGAATASRVSQILTDTSAYTAQNVLGSLSIDTAAVASAATFPDSVYGAVISSSSLSASSTPSASTSTSVSASSTSTAATATNTLVVAKTPADGEYGNVTAAIAALPNDGKDYTISIRAGTYEEQFIINRSGKVTLRGETAFPNDFSQNQVTIQFSYGVLTSAGQNELTPVINAKKTDGSGLALYNINFVNTYPQTKNTAALAADFYGTNMAAYGCKFIGYQDTLLANKGTQVFSNCYIEGSIDYIWGFSTAYFHQCYIASNTAGGYISAMSRASASATGGYVFDKCYVTYTSTYGSTFGTSYLGRPYSSYSIAVYMNSFIDKHISSAGWSVWQTSNPQTDNILFGEFNNTGPGSWSSSRATFATNLTESQAAAYSLGSWIGSTAWLDMDAYNYAPSYDVSGASASSTSPSTTTTSAVPSATATWAHPSSGATPPAGAVLVSVGGSVNGSYSSLTDALAALPSDASTQIIFMYPGTYNEQPPAVNRPGPVQIIGAQDGNAGQTYKANKVILTQSRGLSVSPLPTGHSDAETATFSTSGTKIAVYNVDIINSDNLDGSLSSYVTLAGSIYGSRIAFYGCSFIGWQDTLLTGSTNGYQYYESCYIDGAIDFIWGYSKAYFKGCTIGAKRQKSAITAHSRASSSAIGGYIFDQCLFTAASTATVDLTQSVYLGRPYSQYALVVIKNSYLDNIIQPAGWKVWSTSDPRTAYVTFAEFNNTGPGNWENNAAARTAFGSCTLLTSDTYTLSAVMDSPSDWIDMTYWDSITTPTVAASSTTTPTTVNGTSVYDGTTPPAGAFIVSKTAIEGVTTYDTIQSALNALPTSSSKVGTIFIYPGVYNEQLVLSKSGTTVFIGYSNATDDYSQNQVTIEFNKGIDTQADASNSDSATVYATGNYFQAYNINFKNSFGTTEDYASLGFGVKSSKYASLYGCQVYGNQDSLLINGYLFAFKSLIVGNIDMIWGSGAAYFLSSTISPNTDDVSLTANKRATNTTAAGFVFDQCTVKPAPGTGPFKEISLGRPWNNLARVAYIETYLDSCVEASGWSQWSKPSPQTDGVTFAEYGNTGPGASTSGRATFSTQLSAADAVQFQLTNFFSVTSWINFTHVDVNPFVAGSVPTSSAVSSSALPTTFSTLVSSSSYIPSTIYITKLTTDKETLFTTLTAADSTITSTQTITQDNGVTVTPDPTYKTSTVKSTTTIGETVSQPDVTQTSTVVIISDVGLTITPAPTTVTSTLKDTTTILITSTKAPETTTIKSTITSMSVITKTLDPVTSTLSLGSTITITSVSTPKSSQVTSTTTITSGTGGTSTKTTKAATSYVTITSVKTTTKKTTTTLSCIPTAHAAIKRRHLQPRAAGDITTTIISTLTSFVKTSTATLPARSTTTSVLTLTKTTGSLTTLKPSTITTLTTSWATKSAATTIPGRTTVTTTTSTKLTGKTTTLKAGSTSTVTVTQLSTRTATTSVTAGAGAVTTTTSLATAVVKTTTTLSASTRIVTVSKVATSTVVSTAPVTTQTVWKTVKTTVGPSATTVVQSTVVATTTVKSTSTVVSVVSKTSKGAAACTAA
ncbi:Pectinesterase A [Lasiodiplodia hormozganensis]|uniref:pectinesterase n=1 Tax=Lasiodiplodia hormozganensis TaxID=869390 RepID=A0AA39Z1T7_9PEZI|nr:Pectinesterase A [Lasiodiplodia hormozganensis]